MNVVDYVVQQVINAVSLGSLYALIAVGLSLVFGILKLINFAHGDMMMVGAFAALVLQGAGVPFAGRVRRRASPGGGLAGYAMERVAFRPVRGAPDVTVLLTSLGVTFILENLGILLFSASPRNFPLPAWLGHVYQLAGGRITFTNINVVTLAFAVLAFVVPLLVRDAHPRRAGHARHRRGPHGRAAGGRCASNTVIVVAFVLASSFAGLAGMLWAAQVGRGLPADGLHAHAQVVRRRHHRRLRQHRRGSDRWLRAGCSRDRHRGLPALRGVAVPRRASCSRCSSCCCCSARAASCRCGRR